MDSRKPEHKPFALGLESSSFLPCTETLASSICITYSQLQSSSFGRAIFWIRLLTFWPSKVWYDSIFCSPACYVLKLWREQRLCLGLSCAKCLWEVSTCKPILKCLSVELHCRSCKEFPLNREGKIQFSYFSSPAELEQNMKAPSFKINFRTMKYQLLMVTKPSSKVI